MISSELAAFFESGTSVHAASRDAALRPHGARALAVRADADGAHVTLLLHAPAAARLLDDWRENGRVAIQVCRPSTNRACQLKGAFVEARPATRAESAWGTTLFGAFRDDLQAINIPADALGGWRVRPMLAVRVRVERTFEQTPGPAAGEPLP